MCPVQAVLDHMARAPTAAARMDMMAVLVRYLSPDGECGCGVCVCAAASAQPLQANYTQHTMVRESESIATVEPAVPGCLHLGTHVFADSLQLCAHS
jgi:hypothetical protein